MKKFIAFLLCAAMLLCSMTVSVFAVDVVQNDLIEVELRDYNGFSRYVRIRPISSVYDLKVLIAHEYGTLAENIDRIFYDEFELDNNDVLLDYGIGLSEQIVVIYFTTKAEGDGDYGISVDGMYLSTAGSVISVNIEWESMAFTYYEASVGRWNPLTHEYENPVEDGWDNRKAGITVTNHSDVDINAVFDFESESNNIRGNFLEKIGDSYAIKIKPVLTVAAAEENSAYSEADSKKIYFSPSSSIAVSADETFGKISVKIEKTVQTVYTWSALKSALAKGGGTVKLGRDITSENGELLNVAVNSNRDLTLDLGGHELSAGIAVAENIWSSYFCLKNGTVTAPVGKAALSHKSSTKIENCTLNGSGTADVLQTEGDDLILIDCNIVDTSQKIGQSGIHAIRGVRNYYRKSFLFCGNVHVSGTVDFYNATVTVLPGEYTFDPTKYVNGEDYTVIAGDGSAKTWTVAPKNYRNFSLVSTDEEFSAALSAGGMIFCLKDIEHTGGIETDKDVSIDLNNVTVNVLSSGASGAGIVLTGNSVIKNGRLEAKFGNLIGISGDGDHRFEELTIICDGDIINKSGSSVCELVNCSLFYGRIVVSGGKVRIGGGAYVYGVTFAYAPGVSSGIEIAEGTYQDVDPTPYVNTEIYTVTASGDFWTVTRKDA